MINQNESFVVTGLNGAKTLSGIVEINGAKNAALKAMAAAVLFDGPVILENVPDTEDIRTMAQILIQLGAKVEFQKNQAHDVVIDTTSISQTDINVKLAKSMRASVVLTGPLLARYGRVSFPAPGGCVIGDRPIDMFISAYEKMGAKISETDCIYEIQTSAGLKGTMIKFEKRAVGPTETAMLTAVLAPGKTILENCAQEPEIVNVAEWLNSCGAQISGVGTPTIEIEGTNGRLLKPNHNYVAIPDRIETGSFLILGALCAKQLTIKRCQPDHLKPLIDLLKGSGVPIEIEQSLKGNRDHGTIRINDNVKANAAFRSFDVRTEPYPGFPTDLQSPVVAYLTQVSGQSTVTETVFDGRFKYVADLVKMGAAITEVDSHQISIEGPKTLKALSDEQLLGARDIRAGFAVIIAALVASGRSHIRNVHLIDRGYEQLERKLANIGADIRRIKTD